MRILKFGGTSVGTAERMQSLIPLITGGPRRIVVLSAMSGTTNALLEIVSLLADDLAADALRSINCLELKYFSETERLYSTDAGRERAKQMIKAHFDFVRSFTEDVFTANEEKVIAAQGELLSTAMLHFLLEEKGIASVLLPALSFMRTDDRGEPDMPVIKRYLGIEMALHPEADLFITQGYITRNSFGETDNLKRGGSDYSASIIGAAADADEIQIWTDIDGMHNNDPRIVGRTHPIHRLSFDEAAELAYFGAKILHPACILPAKECNIPVRILNTMQPDAHGTVITSQSAEPGIKAVAAKDGITTLHIKSDRMLLAYGFLRSVFEVFERHKTPIDMITTSEVSVSMTIDNASHLDALVIELSEFGRVSVDPDQSIICIVGDMTGEQRGYAFKVFEALKQVPIRMISYGGSRFNITLTVDAMRKKEAMTALNHGLFNYLE